MQALACVRTSRACSFILIVARQSPEQHPYRRPP
jgi:hypothetical protein